MKKKIDDFLLTTLLVLLNMLIAGMICVTMLLIFIGLLHNPTGVAGQTHILTRLVMFVFIMIMWVVMTIGLYRHDIVGK